MCRGRRRRGGQRVKGNSKAGWVASMRATNVDVTSAPGKPQETADGPTHGRQETLRRRTPGVYNSWEHLHEDQERGHSLQEISRDPPKFSSPQAISRRGCLSANCFDFKKYTYVCKTINVCVKLKILIKIVFKKMPWIP